MGNVVFGLLESKFVACRRVDVEYLRTRMD